MRCRILASSIQPELVDIFGAEGQLQSLVTGQLDEFVVDLRAKTRLINSLFVERVEHPPGTGVIIFRDVAEGYRLQGLQGGSGA